MLHNLPETLAKIEVALQRLNRQAILRSLQEGLSVEKVRSSMFAAGLPSGSDLESLYGWMNGTHALGDVTLDDIHFFPGFYLLSIEDAIANYRSFVGDSRWSCEWFPLFANGGGDFYVMNLGLIPEKPIRHFRIEESNHPVEFASLGAMLKTLSAAFEQCIFFVDSNGYLEMNDIAFGTLAARMNPEVDWWRN